jgi:hypothetical protein
MKVRTSIAAAAVAVALLGGTAALALPASASPRGTSHTLRFISLTSKTIKFSKTGSGRQDTDVNIHGKVVGFDMVNTVVNPKTGKGTILVTVDARGGFLIAVLPLYKRKILHGEVTGGVGSFKDAFGTIETKSLNAAGTRTAVTITYHT